MNKNAGFATKTIHAGVEGKLPHGVLSVPIYQTATFCFNNCEQGGNRFAGEEQGFIYSRLGNPTTSVLEDRISSLEGAEATVAFASGMGAIASTAWAICKAGAHVISDKTLYGCTYAFLKHGLSRYGVEVTFIDMSDLDSLKQALRPDTTMVYLETPANPNLKILDIQAIADIAHAHNADIKVVCDNTFATPYLQRPLSLGCDVVVHSATKYLNGHGDVIAGFSSGKADFINNVRLFGLKDMTGAVLGAFDAFLILRGLKTLTLRMERHCDNAEKLVAYLQNNPKVDKIYFPGLSDHVNHEVAKKQMSRFGGMLSFEVKGGRQAGAKLLDNLKMCCLAVSLGDTETLVQHPASMTHSTYSSEELLDSGIPEGLIRVSAGLEDIDDIIADFEHGFSCL